MHGRRSRTLPSPARAPQSPLPLGVLSAPPGRMCRLWTCEPRVPGRFSPYSFMRGESREAPMAEMTAGTTGGTAGARPAEPGDKGLKHGALGLVSSIVIGTASVAPAYSLAATLGFVVAAVGLQSPI